MCQRGCLQRCAKLHEIALQSQIFPERSRISDIKILNRKRFKPACQSGSKFTESNKTTKEPLSFTERIDKGSSFQKDERV